jgi:hypothetical protein
MNLLSARLAWIIAGLPLFNLKSRGRPFYYKLVNSLLNPLAIACPESAHFGRNG